MPGWCRGCGLCGHPLLHGQRRRCRRSERQRRDRVHGNLQAAVQPLDRWRPSGRHPGRGDEHSVLPVAGVLQRADGRHLPHLPAQERQRHRAGLVRPCHGAAGGGDRHRHCQQPRLQGAGHGELRLGRLRRRLWPGDHPVAGLGPHDPQRRTGRHHRRRRHRAGVEAVRLAGPV
ncbi:hypothetical protein SDC9_163661 [bioreactor metagenome]|uniref:Uncharacterized protein n=1 Tax=bioreactor metagenome TaxID=1076179 RepID=A0A645FRS9_9ZZZZ